MIAASLRAMRPWQWIKNAFVLAPLIFSLNLLQLDLLIRAVVAFVSFCAAASAVYLYNDLRDIKADKLHPTKRHRPIASGDVSQKLALRLSVSLAIGAIAVAIALAPAVGAIVAGYLVLNIAYTHVFKKMAYLDVACIATGFVLRVLSGAYAINVPASNWLLLCTALLSLFLGFGKRAHEVKQLGETTRSSLRGYSLASLRVLLLILGLGAVAAYGGYVRDPDVMRLFSTEKLFWSVPFCLVGICLFLNHTLFSKSESPPTEAMLRDPLFILNLIAWGSCVILLIYRPL